MITEITKEIIKSKVFDIDGHKDNWHFLGPKPAIIYFYTEYHLDVEDPEDLAILTKTSRDYEKLAEKYSASVDFYCWDANQIFIKERLMIGLFEVRTAPSFVFIPLGDEKVTTITGPLTLVELEEFTKKIL